jgi:hypothetical protein
MLTDIFAYRYADVPMWDALERRDRRFIVQAYRIIKEQLFPPYTDGKINEWAENKWKVIHDRLSSELGELELSKRITGYYNPQKVWQSYTAPWHQVCETFLTRDCEHDEYPDDYMKERVSLFEIAFRERESDVKAANLRLPVDVASAEARMARKGMGPRLPGRLSDGIKASNQRLNDSFNSSVRELNIRLRRAGYGLNYHNGYIQISKDEKVEAEIETPFWALVADPKWKNVETDMATAIDMRDAGGPDPAWYAARALESTIKIISDDKGFTHGGEKGAANYIDNLGSKKNGRFIGAWESESMKQFFKDVRNPFGHGAGSADMPKLTDQQTNWAIEFCMIWVRSLVERL